MAFKAHAECSVVESSLPMFILFRKDKNHIHYLHVHTYFSSSNKVVLTLFFLISQHLMAGKSKLYYFIFKSILFLHEEHTLVCAGLYQHRNATERSDIFFKIKCFNHWNYFSFSQKCYISLNIVSFFQEHV